MRKNKHNRSRRSLAPIIWILLLVFAVFAFFKVRTDIGKAVFPHTFDAIVEEQAQQFGLDASLVYAVIKAESNFDPEARSPVGAMGLMQMMPDTFHWMQTVLGEAHEDEALYDPEISIRFGCALLKILLNEYGDLTAALSAYNAGMGNVTSWLSDKACSEDGRTLNAIPFSETRIYVRKVLWYKENYENIYGGMENV